MQVIQQCLKSLSGPAIKVNGKLQPNLGRLVCQAEALGRDWELKKYRISRR